MSKHNYSQYSKNNNFNAEEEVAEVVSTVAEVVEETPVTAVVEETVEVVAQPEPKIVTGVVVNCTKLNVRVNPSTTADIVCVLDANSEVKINVAKSNDEWFGVCTATGVEGYCMRKFVKASL